MSAVVEAGSGLSGAEAAARLRRDGPNLLPAARRRHPLLLLAGQMVKAWWEPRTWRRLSELDRTPSPVRTNSTTIRRAPSDVPTRHYRRHPYPHHANHPTRSRLSG